MMKNHNGKLPIRHVAAVFALAAAWAMANSSATAADWILAPAPYTHNPQTGERVAQYCPIAPVYVYTQPNFTRGVYRYQRSALQVGDSIDNLHIVDQAGPPVQPYREWQFPYRPYSVPYDAWGPANVGIFGGGFGYGFGGPGPWGGGPGPGGFGPGGGGFGGGAFGGYGGNPNPYSPGGGPWGGTYSLPNGPYDPRSGVFGPSEQQEWFDRKSHGPQIQPFPQRPHHVPGPHGKGALGPGASGPT